MKILMVLPYFYPKIGGVENYVLSMSQRLKRQYKHEVIIITSGNEKSEEIINGLKVYRLPFWFKLSNTPINPMWYFQIRKIIEREKPDVINAHTPVPFMADIANLVKGKTKFLLTYHNDLAKSNVLMKIFLFFYYKLLGEKTINDADKIVVTSELYANNSKYLKNYKSKIKIIPPGVDIKLFNPKNIDKQLNAKYKNNKVVLFVGNLDLTHQHKGLNYLIEAIKTVRQNVPSIKLVIVGNGNGHDLYRSIVNKYELEKNVDFFQNIGTESLPHYYNLADVVVLPSTNESEGFGMVLIEAGACGKPVIGSRVGGIPYVIDDNKTGILVEPKKSIALARAIEKMLKDKEFANRLGSNGYEKVIRYFTWDKQVEKTNDIFSAL